ncbi:MAG: general secretion pathway protein GspK [Kiritimatiellae bacterium]|nr:general secretion pathway protein GspK [Kiritimatiellia bacterium]
MALWSLMILSLLISAFAFDMHVEAGITSYYRKRVKAQYLARAGVEWAKVVLARSAEVEEDEEAEEGREDLVESAIQLSRGMAVRGLQKELGEGFFSLDIVVEEGRFNVNQLSDEDWENVLDQANVPEDQWPELIDCFQDWVDKGDEHHLNGAESDDPFYVERGYECKNAPLDMVDELLLIKGFDEGVVYGRPAEGEDEEPLLGIAQWLTVWGDGKVNVNSASREVLLLLPEIDEWMVDDIIEGRKGVDGEAGTRDDGFENTAEVEAKTGALPAAVKNRISTSGGTFVRVTSIGEVKGVRSGIWCILRREGQQITPVFWREENMP